VTLAGRYRGHLGVDPGLFQRPDHERPIKLGHRVIRDQGNLRVAHELEEPLDGVLRRARDDDRVRVPALRAPLDRTADWWQLDRVNRLDEVPAEELCCHASSLDSGALLSDHPIG